MNHDSTSTKTALLLILELILAVTFLLALPFITLNVQAQPAPPAGGPTSPQGQFYTLQQIFDRLDSGATSTKNTAFTGPPAGPIASTVPSINDIMAIAPAIDDTNCASPSDVLENRTYFSLCTSDWGEQTGTTPQPVNTPELLATGQNSCYDVAGTTITCTGTGQDGELQLGATASPRFTNNSDGTITDNLTGLIWLQNANCAATLGGVTKTTTLVWADALTWSNNMASGSCGLTDGSVAGDWRLPNRRELLSLVDYQRSSPSLPTGHPFTGVVSGSYWSSTTRVDLPTNAWLVSFLSGITSFGTKTGSRDVWPVR